MKLMGFIGFVFCFLNLNYLEASTWQFVDGVFEPETVGYLREKFNSIDWKTAEPDLMIFDGRDLFANSSEGSFILPSVWLRLSNGSYLPL